MKNSINKTSALKVTLAACCGLLLTLSCMAQPSNKCLSFNGTNSLVYFPNNDLQLSNNTKMSICAWINWSNKANADSNAVIMSVADSVSNNGQFWLQHNATNSNFQFTIQTDSLSKTTINSITNPIQGNWYYVAGVFDGTNVNIYVNGHLEGSAPVISGGNINAYNTTFKTTMGAGLNGNNEFNGLIDEVSVWNRALDSTQFQYFMCKKLNNVNKGIYDYWNMDSVNTDTIFDLKGSVSGICSNVTITNGGAPIGDTTTYLTNSGSGSFVYVNNLNGDSLIIDSLNFNTTGIYVYEVNAAPADSLIPTGVSTFCTSYYYGMFIPGYQSGSYGVTYYYASTSCNAGNRQSSNSQSSSSPISLVLLNNNIQTSYNWAISNATLSNSKFTVQTQGGQNDFMVGTVSNALGIANNINSAIKVSGISPNPFCANFTLAINCDKSTTVKAHIISLDGKLISETTFSCNQGVNQINFENMSEISAGAYFLNLSDEGGYATTIKMIKN